MQIVIERVYEPLPPEERAEVLRRVYALLLADDDLTLQDAQTTIELPVTPGR